jgi:hypothetical protein
LGHEGGVVRDERGKGALEVFEAREARTGGKGGATEAQDLLGTRILLSRQGLAYGEEFAPFDEMDGSRPTSRNL